MPTFFHDDIEFAYEDIGRGYPFVFLHGLGGDTRAALELVGDPPPGIRILSLDARGHGRTRPLGDPRKLAFSTLAGDIKALLDSLSVERCVIGGISMGAGISLEFATRYESRVTGMVLSRPAWLDERSPPHLELLVEAGRMLKAVGPEIGRREMEGSEAFRRMFEAAEACGSTFLDQFSEPRALECVERLERIPRDCPCPDRLKWAGLRMPTLVVVNERDPIHPLPLGVELAQGIPNARLVQVPSKSESLDAHRDGCREVIWGFLNEVIEATSD